METVRVVEVRSTVTSKDILKYYESHQHVRCLKMYLLD